MAEKRRIPKPAPILDTEDADDRPDDSYTDDRSTFNLGNGGKWRQPNHDGDFE